MRDDTLLWHRAPAYDAERKGESVICVQPRGVRPAHNWLAVFAIIRATGMSEQEIEAKLSLSDIEPEERAALNGWIGPHYPTWVVNFLLYEEITIPHSGSMLTIHQLAVLSDQDDKRVKSRLELVGARGEYRLDTRFRPRIHYKRTVMFYLRLLDDLQIARKLKLRPCRVRARIKAMNIQGIDYNGQILYEPSVLKKLRSARRPPLASKNMYTLTRLAAEFRCGRKKVKEAIAHLKISGKRCRASNGTVHLYYTEQGREQLAQVI